MAIILELSPEQEEQLRDTALAKGLTVEGYLLTLVEAIVQPRVVSHGHRPVYRRALSRLFRTPANASIEGGAHPDEVVRESIREMRKSVLEYKERAVDAVTTMNMLRSAVNLQERQVAQKELQALRALAEQQRDLAKQRWQEMTVREKHLEAVKQELIAAIAAAEERTRAFRQEEERAQARASQAQAGALKAYEAVMLPGEKIAPLIQALHTEAEWEQKFEEWSLLATQEPDETGMRGDLPDPIPVEDAEAFTQKAADLARDTRSGSIASDVEDAEAFAQKAANLAREARIDSISSNDDWKEAMNQLSNPPSTKRAAPTASQEDSPPPDAVP